jgi:hypothetical protein
MPAWPANIAVICRKRIAHTGRLNERLIGDLHHRMGAQAPSLVRDAVRYSRSVIAQRCEAALMGA